MPRASRDYTRSNRLRTLPVRKDAAVASLTAALLAVRDAKERQDAGQELIDALCQGLRIVPPRLIIKDAPRPHRIREGRLSYQRFGTYSVRTHTIRIYNRTARRGLAVAPRTFLETLVHEMVHHLDFAYLGLARSLHTSGFYHRIGHVKRVLVPLTGGD